MSVKERCRRPLGEILLLNFNVFIPNTILLSLILFLLLVQQTRLLLFTICQLFSVVMNYLFHSCEFCYCFTFGPNKNRCSLFNSRVNVLVVKWLNGYNTSKIGKNHPWTASDVLPHHFSFTTGKTVLAQYSGRPRTYLFYKAHKK